MKKNITFATFAVQILYFFPSAVLHAASGSRALLDSNSTFQDLIKSIMGVFNSLIPLLIGAAVIVFLYGVLRFIAKSTSGNTEDHKEGINFMIWGIIGIAVMVSIWGLVAFVTNTLGTTTSVTPQFNGAGSADDTVAPLTPAEELPVGGE